VRVTVKGLEIEEGFCGFAAAKDQDAGYGLRTTGPRIGAVCACGIDGAFQFFEQDQVEPDVHRHVS
jgi:hypothetical protein